MNDMNEIDIFNVKENKKDHIILKPRELENVIGNITNKIMLKIGACDKQNGYIIDIQNIKIQYNIICRFNGDCDYTVTYDVTYLMPKEGHVYTDCRVSFLHETCIICEFKNIHILIPKDKMIDWTFISNSYVHNNESSIRNSSNCNNNNNDNNNKTIISLNSNVTVKIILIQYKNNEIQCIGDFVI